MADGSQQGSKLILRTGSLTRSKDRFDLQSLDLATGGRIGGEFADRILCRLFRFGGGRNAVIAAPWKQLGLQQRQRDGIDLQFLLQTDKVGDEREVAKIAITIHLRP